MPQGKVDITGVASYYYGTWQILMRTEDDIQAAQ
jgi:DNA/RNA endonuclease YhcR with UshA esterase domain